MGGSPKDWFASTADGGTDPTFAEDLPSPDSGLDLTATYPRPLAAGDRLGRYVLEARLGEGGMGVVWRARDPQLDRAVAIKVVHPAIARSPDGAARLLREARAMAKLSHRNVVAVHDAGDDDGQLFVAMELVEGLTLGDVLRGGRGDWRRVLALFTEAGRGLAAAHAAGVLHRDFKPDNVLVDRAGRVCVGDFGLAAFGEGRARRPLAPDAVADELTLTGMVVGTPAFMSPEQLHGRAIDARSDQFSFCVALYQALHGEHPFTGAETASAGALAEAIDQGRVRPPPRGDEVPRWLRAAVVRGLAADPAARWPDMPALLDGLRAPRRVPAIAIGATAAAVVAALLAVLVVWRADRGRGGAPAPGPAAAVRRFDVSMTTRIALSPDGRRIAMATVDRLDVRDLESGRSWTHLDPALVRIDRVQFDGPDRVRFAIPGPLRLATFSLATGAVEAGAQLDGWTAWLGRLTAGELVARPAEAGGVEVGIGDRVIATFERLPLVIAIAPDGARAALILEDRYDGRIVVLDAGGVRVRTAPLPGLTAVTWLSDGELAYATGTVDRPTIFAARLAGDALGPPRAIYSDHRGWFGQLLAGGGRLLFIDSGATFRSRVIDRGAGALSVRDLDTGTVGAVLGWLDDGSFLAWNRGTGAIERHDAGGPRETTPARVLGEAANATRAGTTVILSLRRDLGRELVAISIADGRERWRRPPGRARAVRCAGDRRPPCVVVLEGGAADHQLRAIDPDTGADGAPIGPPGRVDDVAVSDDGREVVISDGTGNLRRLDLATGAATTIATKVAARGVAFDPRGGVLVAGTAGSAQYQVVHVDGADVEVLLQSRNEILFSPRPSPDGASVLAMGRLFLPAVYELPLR